MAILKNCPFCGHSAYGESFEVRKGYESFVQCTQCGATIQTITYDTEEQSAVAATLAWNRRVSDPTAENAKEVPQ